MKLLLKITTDSDYCNQRQELFNGEDKIWSARDLAQDCPEDATLDRDMTDGTQIIHLMKLAFDSGKNGETLSVSEEEI